ncbi:MAG: hypothetical protein FJ100_02300 [Deltaproteobacteria bacterium]|nr:hypothetical protein [Deltaproteobacteria bacterium]
MPSLVIARGREADVLRLLAPFRDGQPVADTGVVLDNVRIGADSVAVDLRDAAGQSATVTLRPALAGGPKAFSVQAPSAPDRLGLATDLVAAAIARNDDGSFFRHATSGPTTVTAASAAPAGPAPEFATPLGYLTAGLWVVLAAAMVAKALRRPRTWSALVFGGVLLVVAAAARRAAPFTPLHADDHAWLEIAVGLGLPGADTGAHRLLTEYGPAWWQLQRWTAPLWGNDHEALGRWAAALGALATVLAVLAARRATTRWLPALAAGALMVWSPLAVRVGNSESTLVVAQFLVAAALWLASPPYEARSGRWDTVGVLAALGLLASGHPLGPVFAVGAGLCAWALSIRPHGATSSRVFRDLNRGGDHSTVWNDGEILHPGAEPPPPSPRQIDVSSNFGDLNEGGDRSTARNDGTFPNPGALAVLRPSGKPSTSSNFAHLNEGGDRSTPQHHSAQPQSAAGLRAALPSGNNLLALAAGFGLVAGLVAWRMAGQAELVGSRLAATGWLPVPRGFWLYELWWNRAWAPAALTTAGALAGLGGLYAQRLVHGRAVARWSLAAMLAGLVALGIAGLLVVACVTDAVRYQAPMAAAWVVVIAFAPRMAELASDRVRPWLGLAVLAALGIGVLQCLWSPFGADALDAQGQGYAILRRELGQETGDLWLLAPEREPGERRHVVMDVPVGAWTRAGPVSHRVSTDEYRAACAAGRPPSPAWVWLGPACEAIDLPGLATPCAELAPLLDASQPARSGFVRPWSGTMAQGLPGEFHSYPGDTVPWRLARARCPD